MRTAVKKIFVLLALAGLVLSFAACDYTAVGLTQEKTDISCNLSFKSMNGTIRRSFNNIYGTDLVLDYFITYGGDSITVTIKQNVRTQELSMAAQ